jgi:hypothetical protein
MKTPFSLIQISLPVIALGLAVQSAKAAYNPVLVDTTSVTGGTSFNYSLNFSTVGDGFVARLDPNSRLTIYDIPGFVSATAAPGFSVNTQNLGMTAPYTTPADDSTLMNVTFTYTGTTSMTGNTLFSGFSIISTYSGVGSDNYTSKYWNASTSSTAGEIGFVTVPSATQTLESFSAIASVPDTGTTAGLLGMSLVCLFGLRRRRA